MFTSDIPFWFLSHALASTGGASSFGFFNKAPWVMLFPMYTMFSATSFPRCAKRLNGMHKHNKSINFFMVILLVCCSLQR
jgi:hypothetical protein